jgi:hypothetical protein
VIGTVIGLVIGLALGIFISPFLLPKEIGTGINNQMQVSGTVPNRTTGILCFSNLNHSIETTANIINGEYSVLLVGGQSYEVYNDHFPLSDPWYSPAYNQFYVPSGVTTFTENLVQRT